MTTTTVPLTIVCPDWCVESPEHHAGELSDLDGCCDHRMADVEVKDYTGYVEPLQEPRLLAPISVRFASLTRINGQEAASPIVFIEDHEHSLQQAEDLACALLAIVRTYRAAGGVA